MREVAFLPITLRDRVVNVLCVHNGAEPLPDAALAGLSTVCQQVGAAYERIILECKRLTQ